MILMAEVWKFLGRGRDGNTWLHNCPVSGPGWRFSRHQIEAGCFDCRQTPPGVKPLWYVCPECDAVKRSEEHLMHHVGKYHAKCVPVIIVVTPKQLSLWEM